MIVDVCLYNICTLFGGPVVRCCHELVGLVGNRCSNWVNKNGQQKQGSNLRSSVLEKHTAKVSLDCQLDHLHSGTGSLLQALDRGLIACVVFMAVDVPMLGPQPGGGSCMPDRAVAGISP